MPDPTKHPDQVLDLLYGPDDGFDVGCDRCFDLLDRYVDAEISGQDADRMLPGMAAHLAACPACHTEHHILRELAETYK